MIVAGKVSGIQQFLFATNEAGGGQAKRLRARSFIISLIAEMAALPVLRALGWPMGENPLDLAGYQRRCQECAFPARPSPFSSRTRPAATANTYRHLVLEAWDRLACCNDLWQ